MNINPFSPTTPHYDSYSDFYKFFEVQPKEAADVTPLEVFPPVEPPVVAKKQVMPEKDKREEKRKDKKG